MPVVMVETGSTSSSNKDANTNKKLLLSPEFYAQVGGGCFSCAKPCLAAVLARVDTVHPCMHEESCAGPMPLAASCIVATTCFLPPSHPLDNHTRPPFFLLLRTACLRMSPAGLHVCCQALQRQQVLLREARAHA